MIALFRRMRRRFAVWFWGTWKNRYFRCPMCRRPLLRYRRGRLDPEQWFLHVMHHDNEARWQLLQRTNQLRVIRGGKS